MHRAKVYFFLILFIVDWEIRNHCVVYVDPFFPLETESEEFGITVIFKKTTKGPT